MIVTLRLCVMTVLLGGLTAGGVSCRSEVPERNDRDAMETVDLKLNGQPFRVWVARTDEERNQGLMNVTADEIAPLPDGTERGMLFVFSEEEERAFWMKNTIISLDIAYMKDDGTIVKTLNMPALARTKLGLWATFPSEKPARFALEIASGRLETLGLFEDGHIEIPDSILKPRP